MIEVRLVVNSVPFGVVQISNAEIQDKLSNAEAFGKSPQDSKTTITISKDVTALFRDTKAEYDRRFEPSGR
jgi:hypothetical protein